MRGSNTVSTCSLTDEGLLTLYTCESAVRFIPHAAHFGTSISLSSTYFLGYYHKSSASSHASHHQGYITILRGVTYTITSALMAQSLHGYLFETAARIHSELDAYFDVKLVESSSGANESSVWFPCL